MARITTPIAQMVSPALALLMLLVAWLSLSLGSVQISTLHGLLDWLHGGSNLAAIVIGEIRLPRTLLALSVGAALGLSGAALQGLLRNPLAEPGLTGASQGAALGAAVVFYFGLWSGLGSLALAIAGLLGASIALFLMLLLAGRSGPGLVILAGLAISTLCGALLAAALNFAPNPYAMQELVFWLLGSVSERGLEHLWVIIPALLIGGLLIYSQRRLLLALTLGEQVAHSLGFSYGRGSRLIILGCAILVGAAVAVAGSISFVGLLVPHLLRPLLRQRPDLLLIPSALAGAVLVCLADITVRLLPAGQELKLGVLTALIGTPLFVLLIWKERRQWS